MVRFFLFSSAVFAAINGFSQQVAIAPSTIGGIQLAGPQSPNFTAMVAEIVGPDQPPAFTEALPYGVVIRNNSAQPLAAVCVVWTGTFNPQAAGPIGSWREWFANPSSQIAPGQSVVAVPSGGILSTPRDLNRYARRGSVSSLRTVQQAHAIEVSLDGVVFASGQFLGPDTYHEYEDSQAQLTVPRSVAATLLQKRDTGTISDVVTWLQALDAQSQPGTSDLNARQRGGAARGMLAYYRNKGEAALYQMAENVVQLPVFPLHR